MSMKEGTYLGGIRTPEDLRLRCRVDEDTGCWNWSMSLVNGAPKVHFVTPDTGKRVCMRGRRAALYLATGKDVKKGHFAFAKLCCKSELCINPSHCRSGTREQHGQWIRQTGIGKTPAKSAASRKVWDRRGRKLTPEMVIEARNSTEPIMKLADRFGVSGFALWSARVGRSHKHIGAAASVFNWRDQVQWKDEAA